MTLIEAIKHLDNLPDDHSIYALPAEDGWHGNSKAAVIQSLYNDDEISKALSEGMLPVLSVFVAKQVIEDWEKGNRLTQISDDEKLDVILYYAEHDAWPPLPGEEE